MKERCVDQIVISDMQPAVFRALLRFIYTDSLPPMDDLSKDDSLEITRHLLVAADRYVMDRLKLICAQILAKSLDVESVTTTLALADTHNCGALKDACIEFIISSNKMDDVTKTQGSQTSKDLALVFWLRYWRGRVSCVKYSSMVVENRFANGYPNC
jgi:speckle-type POZ protein